MGASQKLAARKLAMTRPAAQLPAAMIAAGRIVRPADPLQTVDVEAEEHSDDAEIIIEIAQIDHAAGDGVEARTGAQQLQHLRAAVAEKGDQGLGAEQIEERTDQGGDDQADDLVFRLDADKEADGDIGRREKERRDIAAEHRSPVKRPEETDGDRQRQGQEQRQADQARQARNLPSTRDQAPPGWSAGTPGFPPAAPPPTAAW